MSDELFHLIVRLKLNKALNREHMRMSCNLSSAEYRGIMAYRPGLEMTCQEMSKVMELSPSRSSRVIDNLVQKGYMIRKISRSDRRSISITLSSKGKEIRDRIIKNRENLEDNLQNSFSEEEIETIKRSIKKLLDYFI